MSKVFFGFAVADSMFPSTEVVIRRNVLQTADAVDLITSGVEPCLNPSHQATISAMGSRFGIEVKIPEKAPIVKLGVGDQLLVMSVRGLPRLDATRHEYTAEEIASASFVFSLYVVEEPLSLPDADRVTNSVWRDP